MNLEKPLKLKGFVFSFEALVAVILTVSFLYAVSHSVSAARTGDFTLQLQRAASDVMFVMEKNSTFDQAARLTAANGNARLNSSLYALLASNLNGNVTLQVYEYTDPGFDQISTSPYSAATGAVPTFAQVATAQRIMVTNDSSGNNLYAIALVKVWYK